MAKKAAAAAEAEAAPAMTAELLCSKEFPELEGTYLGDRSPDAKKICFCTHPTAAQEAEVMARRAYFREQEGFGELRFRYLDLKWRDDSSRLAKAINKLCLIHVDSARGLKEGPRPAKGDPNHPERVPDDRASLSVAADWEQPALERAWAEGLKLDEK
eukprot:3783274-Rhodomonas_salina.1